MPARKHPAPETASGGSHLTFEAALERLRTIVDELERGGVYMHMKWKG